MADWRGRAGCCNSLYSGRDSADQQTVVEPGIGQTICSDDAIARTMGQVAHGEKRTQHGGVLGVRGLTGFRATLNHPQRELR